MKSNQTQTGSSNSANNTLLEMSQTTTRGRETRGEHKERVASQRQTASNHCIKMATTMGEDRRLLRTTSLLAVFIAAILLTLALGSIVTGASPIHTGAASESGTTQPHTGSSAGYNSNIGEYNDEIRPARRPGGCWICLSMLI